MAVAIVLVWAVSGPWFHYSDTWQLVINTGTTVVTFLMVFLIQRSQNKDSRAIHLKLNEIVVVLEGASNKLINVEDMTEAEVHALHERYQKLLALAQQDRATTESHSIEEPELRPPTS
jgi:low affinity Fe/Cu permease